MTKRYGAARPRSAGFGSLAVLLLAAATCTAQTQSREHVGRVDADALFAHVEALAADSMEGRRTGTPGHQRARNYILNAFEETGLERFGDSWVRAFTFTSDRAQYRGENLVGLVRGTSEPDRYIVFTAHYDHLGIQNDQIFNGADDNASGVGALLALAGYFREHPPRHSILFVAIDAEEFGLEGARAFVADPPVPLESIVVNVNADMISHSPRRELYAAGTFHYPVLGAYLDRVGPAEGVTLLRGHDQPHPVPEDDWTMLSDHGAFHEKGIPFLYFGVEDHAHYHKPTDVFENIHSDFYVGAVETILSFVLALDEDLSPLVARVTEREAAGVR
jgi:Zn-dependent M28 family amino/carboxypeptidase